MKSLGFTIMFNIAHKVQTIFHASLCWGVNIKLAMFQSNGIVTPRCNAFSLLNYLKKKIFKKNNFSTKALLQREAYYLNRLYGLLYSITLKKKIVKKSYCIIQVWSV